MVSINKLYVACECGRNVLLIHKYMSLGYDVIIICMQPDKLKEMMSYGVRMPFIVNNGEVIKL
jgi:hypothetical protein